MNEVQFFAKNVNFSEEKKFGILCFLTITFFNDLVEPQTLL